MNIVSRVFVAPKFPFESDYVYKFMDGLAFWKHIRKESNISQEFIFAHKFEVH